MKILACVWAMCLCFFSQAWAVPADLDLKKLPIQDEYQKYENKEYLTAQDYLKALGEGKCSSVWVWMHMVQEDKISLLNSLKSSYGMKSSVVIAKSSDFYVKELDELFITHPESQYYSLSSLFRVIAVLNEDFDEGTDKDATARKYLGAYYSAFLKQK